MTSSGSLETFLGLHCGVLSQWGFYGGLKMTPRYSRWSQVFQTTISKQIDNIIQKWQLPRYYCKYLFSSRMTSKKLTQRKFNYHFPLLSHSKSTWGSHFGETRSRKSLTSRRDLSFRIRQADLELCQTPSFSDKQNYDSSLVFRKNLGGSNAIYINEFLWEVT